LDLGGNSTFTESCARQTLLLDHHWIQINQPNIQGLQQLRTKGLHHSANWLAGWLATLFLLPYKFKDDFKASCYNFQQE